MSASLRSENLTISMPYEGCDKDCKYCISKMTGYEDKPSPSLMGRNKEKVKTVALSAGITSVLITGKGEPLVNERSRSRVDSMGKSFREWPVELQTNGLFLMKNPQYVQHLWKNGFDTIAISIDSKKQLDKMKPVFKAMRNVTGADALNVSMTPRITVNVSDQLGDLTLRRLLTTCKVYKIRQLLLRKLSVPNYNVQDFTPHAWISKHADDGRYETMQTQLEKLIKKSGQHIRTLNTGEKVYDVEGVSVVSVDYCIQEESSGTDLRSLIFHEDGHLYTSWNSKASILF